MAKEDIFQHSLRLNLNNPKHLKIHQVLMNIDADTYGSKNNYMVNVLYDAFMSGRAEDSSCEEFILTREERKSIEKNITEKVMNEVLKTLLNMVVSNAPQKAYQMPVGQVELPEEEEEIDEAVVEAALAYFGGD